MPQMSDVTALIDKWKPVLGLHGWRIKVEIGHGAISEIDGDSARILLAQVHTKWQYMSASILLDRVQLDTRTPEELEEDILHEMLHMVLAELTEGMAAHEVQHEERVVTMLTQAFLDVKGNTHAGT